MTSASASEIKLLTDMVEIIVQCCVRHAQPLPSCVHIYTSSDLGFLPIRPHWGHFTAGPCPAAVVLLQG